MNKIESKEDLKLFKRAIKDVLREEIVPGYNANRYLEVWNGDDEYYVHINYEWNRMKHEDSVIINIEGYYKELTEYRLRKLAEHAIEIVNIKLTPDNLIYPIW